MWAVDQVGRGLARLKPRCWLGWGVATGTYRVGAWGGGDGDLFSHHAGRGTTQQSNINVGSGTHMHTHLPGLLMTRIRSKVRRDSTREVGSRPTGPLCDGQHTTHATSTATALCWRGFFGRRMKRPKGTCLPVSLLCGRMMRIASRGFAVHVWRSVG